MTVNTNETRFSIFPIRMNLSNFCNCKLQFIGILFVINIRPNKLPLKVLSGKIHSFHVL